MVAAWLVCATVRAQPVDSSQPRDAARPSESAQPDHTSQLDHTSQPDDTAAPIDSAPPRDAEARDAGGGETRDATDQAALVPDLVTLPDGSFYRGVIVESTAERVVLRLPSGALRTFDRSSLATAGPETLPSAPEPGPAPPAITHLHITGDAEGLVVQHVTGRENAARMGPYWSVQVITVDRYESLCAPPCDIDLPAGERQFGVSHGTGRAVRAGGPLLLPPGDVDLRAHFEDREPIRIAGIVGGSIGAVAGFAMAFAGIFLGPSPCGFCTNGDAQALLIGGLGTVVVSTITGFALAFWWDDASVAASAGGIPLGGS